MLKLSAIHGRGWVFYSASTLVCTFYNNTVSSRLGDSSAPPGPRTSSVIQLGALGPEDPLSLPVSHSYLTSSQSSPSPSTLCPCHKNHTLCATLLCCTPGPVWNIRPVKAKTSLLFHSLRGPGTAYHTRGKNPTKVHHDPVGS